MKGTPILDTPFTDDNYAVRLLPQTILVQFWYNEDGRQFISKYIDPN